MGFLNDAKPSPHLTPIQYNATSIVSHNNSTKEAKTFLWVEQCDATSRCRRYSVQQCKKIIGNWVDFRAYVVRMLCKKKTKRTMASNSIFFIFCCCLTHVISLHKRLNAKLSQLIYYKLVQISGKSGRYFVKSE